MVFQSSIIYEIEEGERKATKLVNEKKRISK